MFLPQCVERREQRFGPNLGGSPSELGPMVITTKP